MAQPDANADEQRVQFVLARYRARVAQLASQKQAKPDMVAFKELKEELTPESAFGHIAGIKPGDSFGGRGELAILGLHKQMMRGIDDVNNPRGAYAIVLSGGYADDDDTGNEFTYTGEGGQEGRKQAKDQTWTRGNLGLQRSCQTQTPVRGLGCRAVDSGARPPPGPQRGTKPCCAPAPASSNTPPPANAAGAVASRHLSSLEPPTRPAGLACTAAHPLLSLPT